MQYQSEADNLKPSLLVGANCRRCHNNIEVGIPNPLNSARANARQWTQLKDASYHIRRHLKEMRNGSITYRCQQSVRLERVLLMA